MLVAIPAAFSLACIYSAICWGSWPYTSVGQCRLLDAEFLSSLPSLFTTTHDSNQSLPHLLVTSWSWSWSWSWGGHRHHRPVNSFTRHGIDIDMKFNSCTPVSVDTFRYQCLSSCNLVLLWQYKADHTITMPRLICVRTSLRCHTFPVNNELIIIKLFMKM